MGAGAGDLGGVEGCCSLDGKINTMEESRREMRRERGRERGRERERGVFLPLMTKKAKRSQMKRESKMGLCSDDSQDNKIGLLKK
jgi:hypothetical protein